MVGRPVLAPAAPVTSLVEGYEDVRMTLFAHRPTSQGALTETQNPASVIIETRSQAQRSETPERSSSCRCGLVLPDQLDRSKSNSRQTSSFVIEMDLNHAQLGWGILKR
jgi:hypothetical protein